MKKSLIVFSVIVSLISCKKETIATDKLINSLLVSPKIVEANGTSIVSVTCQLNSDATSDKREVIFKTTAGQFVENKEQKIVKKAEFENEKLIVKTDILVPMQAGTLTITAEPNLPDIIEDYIATDSVSLIESVPVSIKVSNSSFFVWNNDLKSEVTITGTLFNSSGKKVSMGNNVIGEDYFENNMPVGGRFRETFLSSNSDSKVSTIYTPGNVPVGSNIFIKLTLLDDLGVKTNIRDSVLITIK